MQTMEILDLVDQFFSGPGVKIVVCIICIFMIFFMKHKDSQRWKLTQKDLNDHVNEARKWREEEIALEMVKHDLDDTLILKCTGISREQLRDLKGLF